MNVADTIKLEKSMTVFHVSVDKEEALIRRGHDSDSSLKSL